jgi:hypothetical protein
MIITPRMMNRERTMMTNKKTSITDNWLFLAVVALILGMTLLSMAAQGYPAVSMIDNTPVCLSDCHTTYRVCPDKSVSSVAVTFTDKSGQPIDKSYSMTKPQVQQYQRQKDTYKDVTREIIDPNNAAKRINITDKVLDKSEMITDYRKIETPTTLEDMRREMETPGCYDYRVSGSLLAGTAIDNILVIDGHAYTEFAWWNSTFSYIRPVFFNSTAAGNLANFPAFVTINSAALISAGKLNNSCKDIRIVLNNASILPYEVEDCDRVNTTIWFKLPNVGAGTWNQNVSLYYGNMAAQDAQNKSGLWSDYALVVHGQSTGATGVFFGSSPNGVNLSAGCAGGNSVRQINNSLNCRFGSCVEFNASNGCLEVTGLFNATPNARGFTASAWGYRLNNNSAPEASVIFSFGVYADAGTRYLIFDRGAGGYLSADTQGAAVTAAISMATRNRAGLNFYGGVWDLTGYSRSFYNSTYSTNDATSATSTSNYVRVGMGSASNWGWAQNSNIGAVLDEIRVTQLDINRSIDWMLAEYGARSQIGAEELGVTYPLAAPSFLQNMTSKIPQNTSILVNWSAVISNNSVPVFYNLSVGARLLNGSLSATNYTYNATDAIGSYRFNLSAYDGVATSNKTLSTAFDICVISYNCTSYAACAATNISACSAVTDTGCGFPYNGSLSAYDVNCTYAPPAPVVPPGSFYDLTTQTGVLLFGIVLFFWLALLTISFIFRTLPTMVLCWCVGVLLGFWLYQFGAGWAFGFMLMESGILMAAIKGRR